MAKNAMKMAKKNGRTIAEWSRVDAMIAVCEKLSQLLMLPDVLVETVNGDRVLGVADKGTGALAVSPSDTPGCWINGPLVATPEEFVAALVVFRKSNKDGKALKLALNKPTRRK